MKELEALIIKGDSDKGRKQKDSVAKKLSPVQAILANAGVSYTHENSEVIGTSTTEMRLSRKAAEAATTTPAVANRPIFGGDSRSQLKRHGPDARGNFNDVMLEEACRKAP